MPLKRIAQQLEPMPSEEQGIAVKQPCPGPAEAEPMEPGRPYQAFVESRLRQYLRDNNIRNLVKPAQQEIRAAALPILCQALRRRPGRKLDPYLNMAHHAVADVVERAREQRWTRRPLSEPYASPNYIDALIQLADDADWLAREVPLPEHPPPKHPPIYYTIDPATNLPVPRADSLIRGDYVYKNDNTRVTEYSHIYPWIPSVNSPEPRMNNFDILRRNTCYVLERGLGRLQIYIHWIERMGNILVYNSVPLESLYFTPQPPAEKP